MADAAPPEPEEPPLDNPLAPDAGAETAPQEGGGKKKKSTKNKGIDTGKAVVGAVTNPKQAAKDAKKLAKAQAKAAKEAAKEAAKKAREDIAILFQPGEGAYLRSSQKRGCTDCACCCIFIAYWCAMIFLAHFALHNGDVNALVFPRDSEQNSCGLKNLNGPDYTKKQRLYLPNPANTEIQICVAHCPGEPSTGACTGNVSRNYYTDGSLSSLSSLSSESRRGPDKYLRESTCVVRGDCTDGTADTIERECTILGDCYDHSGAVTQHVSSAACLLFANHSQTGNTYVPYEWTAYEWTYFDNSASFVCQPEEMAGSPASESYPPNDLPTALLNGWISSEGPCFMPVLKSKNIVYRCIPTMLEEFSNPEALKKNAQAAKFAQYFYDVLDYWHLIPMGAFLSLVLSFLWINFLAKFAGFLIWTTVYGIEILLPPLSLVCFYKAGMIQPPIDIPQEMQEVLHSVEESQTNLQLAGYTLLIVWAVFLVLFCIFKSRIRISIGVIEEASDAFLDLPEVIFMPLGTLILSLPVTVYGIVSTALLLSLREVDANGNYVYSDELRGMILGNIFGWLWTVEFFASIQFTSVAGACADWYFTPEDEDGDKDVQYMALFRSISRTVRFHMGTMAVGAFIVAAVKMIKYACIYAINQVQAQSPENKLIQFLGNCLKVLVSCIERFIRFLGHVAYIETAVYGKNFCSSLLRAFKRLIRNAIRFSFVTLFSKLVIFLGKLLAILGAIWLVLLIHESGLQFTAEEGLDGGPWFQFKDVHAHMRTTENAVPQVPLVLAGVAAAIVSFAIMGTYETAIDTIMVCFLEDEAENDDNGYPTFASGELKSFMSGTKSIADAQEAFVNSVRDAKTAKLRANNESETHLLGQTKGLKGKKTARQAVRKEKKKARKANKKGSKKGNSESADDGANTDAAGADQPEGDQEIGDEV